MIKWNPSITSLLGPSKKCRYSECDTIQGFLLFGLKNGIQWQINLTFVSVCSKALTKTQIIQQIKKSTIRIQKNYFCKKSISLACFVDPKRDSVSIHFRWSSVSSFGIRILVTIATGVTLWQLGDSANLSN